MFDAGVVDFKRVITTSVLHGTVSWICLPLTMIKVSVVQLW